MIEIFSGATLNNIKIFQVILCGRGEFIGLNMYHIVTVESYTKYDGQLILYSDNIYIKYK